MNQKVIIRRPGGLDQITLADAPDPLPGEGEALVRVLAAGGRFPVTPGYDLVGTVEALGPETSRVRVGDRVAALSGTGAQQQLVCLSEAMLVAVPPGIAPEKAVAVVLNYSTALQLLTRAVALKAGQTAFIYGLAGGLGSAVQQVAAQLGIRLYGTASGARLAEARRGGAIAFDRQDPDWIAAARAAQPGGFDAVFDPVGGDSLPRSYGLLATHGTLVMLGAAATVQGTGDPRLKMVGTLARFLWLKLHPGSRHVRLWVTSQARQHPDQFRKDLDMVFGWLAEGKIDPAIHAVLPLGEACRAQDMLERSAAAGKIVLIP